MYLTHIRYPRYKDIFGTCDAKTIRETFLGCSWSEPKVTVARD